MTFEKITADEIEAAEQETTHACFICEDCKLCGPSVDAKVVFPDGGVEWACPLCDSDDCTVFNPNYTDVEDEENYNG